MNTYKIICSHLGSNGFVELPIIVQAETIAKARYKAFMAYKEAFRPDGPNPFIWFIKYVLIDIKKEANDGR